MIKISLLYSATGLEQSPLITAVHTYHLLYVSLIVNDRIVNYSFSASIHSCIHWSVKYWMRHAILNFEVIVAIFIVQINNMHKDQKLISFVFLIFLASLFLSFFSATARKILHTVWPPSWCTRDIFKAFLSQACYMDISVLVTEFKTAGVVSPWHQQHLYFVAFPARSINCQ